jgi:short-subunit dehydrogenase
MDALVMAGRLRAVNARAAVVSPTARAQQEVICMAQEVALVTGASSGIGEALARRIARDGRHIVLVARRGDRLETLARELKDAHGVTAHVIIEDLVRPGAARELVEEVERRGLTVDWLVNNAGFGTSGRFDRLPVDGELDEIRLNVEVLVELTGRCLPAMVARKAGVVMNIASVAAFTPGPFMSTYSATKAFVLTFTEGIAAELRGTGVQVLCVCPGFTRTEFQRKAEVDVSGIPSFAWMSAEQVADQAVRAVGRGPVLVNGAMNNLMTAALRFVPRGLVSRATAALLKPKEA